MLDAEDGARFVMGMTWVNGGGHIVNVEKANGALYYIDAQNPNDTNRNMENAVGNSIDGMFRICRVDDKMITKDILTAQMIARKAKKQ